MSQIFDKLLDARGLNCPLPLVILDEVVLDPGQLFDAFTLLAKLVQKEILFVGQPAHPPETNTPANGPRQSHPEREAVLVHSQ